MMALLRSALTFSIYDWFYHGVFTVATGALGYWMGVINGYRKAFQDSEEKYEEED